MSQRLEPPARPRRARSVLSVLLALLGVAAVVAGGALLPAESVTFRPTPLPLVGRTSTVCTLPAPAPKVSVSVAAVVVRRAPGRDGSLTATTLGQTAPSVTLTDQGVGRLLRAPAGTQVLQGEGVMATASSAEVFSRSASGPQGGLMAAPCGVPGTEHWFVGVGAASQAQSELVLTNPDDAHAEVDLRFFGVHGQVVVPGSPGVVVPAHGSRTLSLASQVSVAGPLSVTVLATTGRVSAISRDLRSQQLAPAGADWQVSARPPTTSLVIPGVPAGDGRRQLVVVNPGTVRARIQVQVLALAGPFAPVGAHTVDVAPLSTATVDLTAGLVGQAAAVALTSDQPVTGSVVSTSSRSGAASDFAVQSATAPLVGAGVVALAAAPGVSSELVLSNSAAQPTLVKLEVSSFDGATLHTDDVLLGPHSSATRRLDQPPPAYLEVRAPPGSAVHGAVAYGQPEGAVAGLATVPLTSPDVGIRAPLAVPDPTVGR